MPRPLTITIVRMAPVLAARESLRRLRPVRQSWGSDEMRADQLVSLIRPHLRDEFEIRIAMLPRPVSMTRFRLWLARQPRGVFVLLKNVAYSLTPEQVHLLRNKATAVAVDHIDGDMAKIDLAAFDIHVAASRAALRALRDKLPEQQTALLLHHADPRLTALEFSGRNAFAALYLGYLPNLRLPPDLEGQLTRMHVYSTRDMNTYLSRLPGFNFHYAVRDVPPAPDGLRVYKPFTKGLTAAACRSNILVNRDVDDATDFLGEDYPYLIDDADPARATETFARARAEFGSPRWAEGLDRLRAAAEMASPPVLARQFEAIARQVIA